MTDHRGLEYGEPSVILVNAGQEVFEGWHLVYVCDRCGKRQRTTNMMDFATATQTVLARRMPLDGFFWTADELLCSDHLKDDRPE